MLSDPITSEHVEGVVNAFLKRHFDQASEIPECHREWWSMCCSIYPYVALAAPRGHAKSTAITHSYTIANILFRERKFVLIISDTETQATFFLADIKKELTENEDLVKTFGIKGLSKDAISDFIVDFDDGGQARVIAKGSGQSLRGVKWDGKRPDLIVCDDLENDEIVMNKERREAFRRWFSNTLLPCRSKNGIIRVVGTILHMDSMLERLMPKEQRKDVVVEELRTTLSRTSNNIWKSAKYRAHNKDMTKALWPEHKPISWLKKEREVYLEQGMSDSWSQEMLNVPLDEQNAPFKRTDFREMDDEDRHRRFNYYISSDLALSIQQSRDYSIFVVGGIDTEGVLCIRHVIRARMDPIEISDTIFSLNDIYKPEIFFFEKGQAFLAVEAVIQNRMHVDEKFFMYETFPSITDKMTRAMPIRARMRAGAVKFDKNSEWWPDFEEECLRFPRGAHDDQVDALSLMGRGLNKFLSASTDKELRDEEIETEKEESGLFEQGRSQVTGY